MAKDFCVNRATMRRSLDNLGYHSYPQERSQDLTDAHVAKRLALAPALEAIGEDFGWENINFMEENLFYVSVF